MFKYCPLCRSDQISFDRLKHYRCNDCTWSYFHNVAAAVGVFFTINGKLLFTVRARQPALGKLDLPGGFVDPGESAQQALKREIKEELDLDNINLIFLGTAPNIYPYDNVTYHSCDLVYTAALHKIPPIRDRSEIADLKLYHLDEIPLADIAFDSIKTALNLYRLKISDNLQKNK